MTVEIMPTDFPGLDSLCWNRSKTTAIDRETAWGLYRANWRFIFQDELTDQERDLIGTLEAEHGERLLGTDGPPPFAGRQTMQEQVRDSDLICSEDECEPADTKTLRELLQRRGEKPMITAVEMGMRVDAMVERKKQSL